MAFVARLKPLDPRRGQVAETYSLAEFDLRWNQGTVHRGLTASQAEKLRGMRQPGKGKAPLFDVHSEEEWDDVLAREAAAKLGLPEPIAARVMPTVSAPKAAPSEPAAPETPPVLADVAVPIEALDHTDANGIRVQHTQAAPEPPAAAPVANKGPKKPGGNK